MKKKISIEEKAIFLLIYSFLEQAIREGHIGINKNYAELGTDITAKIYNIYYTIKQTRRSFVDLKAQKFLLKRVNNPNKYTIDIVYLSILLLYFYRIADIKRVINPISIKEIKNLLKAIKKNDLYLDEIEIAYNFFIAIYPEKKGIADFIKNNIIQKLTKKGEKNAE